MTPKLLLYRTAVPHWGVVDNRYPSGRIGAALCLGRWCLSFTWRQPARPTQETDPG